MAVITMSREMGTGAYQIAREVARKLKYQLVDGAKLAQMAPQYGLGPDMLERVDEKPPVYITAQDRQHAAQLKTIELMLLDCAQKGNVILYGRGAQDLLRGLGNVLRVRFVAPFDERVEKFAEREWIDPDLARELIRKSDHQRGGFIHFYFDRDWHDPLGYDLVVNTARLSSGAIVDLIVAAARDAKLKEAEAEAKEMMANIILCKKVETELLKSGCIENFHFRISSQDGEICLSGHVHTKEEKQTALKIAAKIKGVRRIDDDLHVITYKQYRE